jgi:hypothetical protein
MSARVPATLLLAASLAAFGAGCRRERAAPEQIQAEIDALEKERAVLRGRIDELVVNDPRRKSMPKAPVRVGVPTALARDLVEKVARGFVDQVALDLRNLKVRKKGTVRKVVTLGEYELKVDIARAYGRLKTGRPDVRFGGNKVSLALPVAIASGEGRATLGFKWDGKNVSDAVCGDLEVTQEVSGRIKPDTYPVGGSLVLQATAREILATPHFPPTRIKLRIDPSAESWAAVQKILDEQKGTCGYVVDKVDVLGIVRRLIDRGFNVRLPTEKIKPIAVPVGIEPTMSVRGQTVELEIKVSALAITEDVIWLGADLKLDLPKLQALVAQPAGEISTPLPPATAPPAAR